MSFKNLLFAVVTPLAFLLPNNNALAAGPSFTNLTQSNFEDISKELSANFMHHSVLGAAPLGKVFGFELGLVGGQSPCPEINTIVKNSGGSDFPNLYHAGILGAVSVPFGITGEIVMLPKTSASDASFEMTSMAAKLTLDETLLVLPFNLAFRGFYTTSKFSFTQTISSALATVQNEDKVQGFQMLVSPKLPLVEPYAGVGYVSAKNSLSVSGTAGNIFLPSFTSSQSAESTPTSTQFLLGINANLLFFHLGAEYSNAFGKNTYTGKLAFGF